MSDDLERLLNIERGMGHSAGVLAERKRIVALVRERADGFERDALDPLVKVAVRRRWMVACETLRAVASEIQQCFELERGE
jgi:hypothetical protein